MHRDDETHGLTEADRTSETRFGPRPVPKGHKTASPYEHNPQRSSRIPPSAPMSPDGRSAWPTPSLTSKIVVWGGVAAAAAAATAGAVIATRKIADAIGNDDDYRPRRVDPRTPRDPKNLAPRFAELDEDEREAMRRRARAQARRDRRDATQLRAKASGRRNAAKDFADTAADLSGSLNGVSESLVSAFQGFRSVASQAAGIVAEFGATADQLRAILGRNSPQDPNDQPSDERRHKL